MADVDINLYHVLGVLTAVPKFVNDGKNPVLLEIRTTHGFTKPDGEAGERQVNHQIKSWGAHASTASGLREGDRVEAKGYYRIEGRDVGEGDEKRTYFDHFCVVDDKEADGALRRV